MKHRIYALIDNKGRIFYIGRTIHPLKERLCGHKTEAKTCVVNIDKCKYIQACLYNITIALLEVCDTIDEAKVKEKFWTHYYGKITTIYNKRPLLKQTP